MPLGDNWIHPFLLYNEDPGQTTSFSKTKTTKELVLTFFKPKSSTKTICEAFLVTYIFPRVHCPETFACLIYRVSSVIHATHIDSRFLDHFWKLSWGYLGILPSKSFTKKLKLHIVSSRSVKMKKNDNNQPKTLFLTSTKGAEEWTWTH